MRSAPILPGLVTLLLACGTATATAEEGPGIACLATGYDVMLHNDSESLIEAGTEVEWRVPFTRTTGSHTLRATLEPGGRVNLSGAMGSDYLVGNSHCEAEIADDSETG